MFDCSKHELYAELESYMAWLQSMSGIEHVIISNRGRELYEYYFNKPELADFTMKTELPRLKDYLVEGQGATISDTKGVAQILLEWENMGSDTAILTRCANQSLWADLFPTITGPYTYVREQYMATLSAKACRFTLNPSTLTAKSSSQLVLRLPTSNGQPWDVAQVNAEVEFIFGDTDGSHSCPKLTYRVKSVTPLLNPYGNDTGRDMLESTAQFLVNAKKMARFKSPRSGQMPRGRVQIPPVSAQTRQLRRNEVLGKRIQIQAQNFWNTLQDECC